MQTTFLLTNAQFNALHFTDAKITVELLFIWQWWFSQTQGLWQGDHAKKYCVNQECIKNKPKTNQSIATQGGSMLCEGRDRVSTWVILCSGRIQLSSINWGPSLHPDWVVGCRGRAPQVTVFNCILRLHKMTPKTITMWTLNLLLTTEEAL